MHGLLYRAETRRRSRRHGEAERDFEQARKQAEELGLIEERWKAVFGLGRIAEQSGERIEAKNRYRQAVDGIEALRSRVESDRLRRHVLADRSEPSEPYERLIELLLRSPDADPSCRDAAFCSELLARIAAQRSRVLTERMRRSGGPASEGASLLRDKLGAAWKRRLNVSPEERAELDLEIERLEGEYESAEKSGRAASDDGPASLARIQAGLDAGSALVVFWVGRESLLRIWVNRDGAGYRLDGFSRRERRAVERYVNTVSEPDGAWRRLAVEVGEILFRDVPWREWSGVSRLLISQDPDLDGAPIEPRILPPGRASVVETWSAMYTPSLDPPTHHEPALSWPWSTTAVAFAYSEPEEDSAFLPLATAAEEAREVGRQLPGRTRVFVENEATREALDQMLLAPSPVWHFASHAVLDDERPELSRLLLAPAEPDSSQPDSILLGEVKRWNLDGARLAVLSACNTARGRAVAGDGVRSLSRAFLQAGVESVVAGLWRVPDRETAALMGQFYYPRGPWCGSCRGAPSSQTQHRLHGRFVPASPSRRRASRTQYPIDEKYKWI